MHLTQRHARCGGILPQPVLMVECSGISSEKGPNSVLLCGFLQAQHMYQKGIIPAATDTGSAGQHGGCHTGWCQSMPPSQWEIWDSMSLLVCPLALQCPHDFSTPHAEHLGRVELDLLCHLFR